MTLPSKLDSGVLGDILSRLELSPELAARLIGCTRASDALTLLVEADCLIEAVRLCAHALPRREAVWWAAQCAAHTAPADLPAADQAARDLAEQWVRGRSDALRRAAMAGAEQAGFRTPEAWAAVAAFWSEGSMSPPEQPAVPPPPHLSGTAVAGAVTLAAVRRVPARQADRLRRFLDSARDLAAGGSGRMPAEAV